MKFLAVSTSQSKASVAYFDNDTDIFSFEADRTVQPSFWLNELLAFFEKFYARWELLDYIAVDIGPGSFTGIKVGLSFVKGLSLGLNKPVFPVNALEGYSHFVPKGKTSVIVSDAGKGMYYFAAYRTLDNARECLVEPCLVQPETFKKALLSFEQKELYIVKDDYIKNFDGDITFSNLPPLAKGIGLVSRVSYQENKLIFASEVTPLYLRVSDAEANLIKQS